MFNPFPPPGSQVNIPRSTWEHETMIWKRLEIQDLDRYARIGRKRRREGGTIR